MKRFTGAVLLLLTAAVLLLAACGDDDDGGNGDDGEVTPTATNGAEPTASPADGDDGDDGDVPEGPEIRVAAFNFDESHILAEIYAQVLEHNGYPVDKGQIMPGSTREIVKPALESGELDLVPEYVGTLLSFLGGEPTADGEENLAEARELFEGVTLLDLAPAQDKNAFVASRDVADEYSLVNVSDLAGVAGDLTLGGPPECPEREFCLIGLEEVYGVTFGDFVPLDFGPRVIALSEGEIDVALLFSTDATIVANDFVLLEDDMGLQPAENIVPAVRNEIVEAYGDDFTSLLNSVSAAITTEGLTALNAEVQIEQRDPDEVATEWLTDNGFLD